MFDRIIITFVIAGGLGLLWLGWRYYKTRIVQSIPSVGASLGRPTLLYFTGDYCPPCELQQTPIVKQLSAKLGQSIEVKTIDVATYPDVASRYRVLTLPTTVVLNPLGQVAHINYGVTGQTKLEKQLLPVELADSKAGALSELHHIA